MKTKKYLIIGTVLILCFTAMSMQAVATSPRYMKLVYEPQTQTLKATILHFSPAKTVHYVYKVDVVKNGNPTATQLYTNQPKFFFYTYTFNVTATTGDELTVTANCNLFGKITRSITL
ncbi:MAG TPA: hypothetical protein VN365_06115 [Candidatus Thermoplasmatota archaeon]|nr:hypothetical protein [Candidatus Thermoplasmatota archaeon]